MKRSVRSVTMVAATGALLVVPSAALASNAQLKQVTVTDQKFITRDASALQAASKGNSIPALKAAGHNLGLGLSEFIKNVTPISTSGSNGHLAKTRLLNGLRKQRHGVQELNHAITEATAGEKAKAKTEITRALNEINAGDRELRRAAATIKSL
jgi:hypothetical protein